MDKRIISFLKSNTNLTMATSVGHVPYCANCFYAYDEEKNILVFKSSKETYHIRQALSNPKIAGTVVPDKLETKAIKGIQFQGNFISPSPPQSSRRSRLVGTNVVQVAHASFPPSGGWVAIYYKKYPFARVFPGNLWAIALTYIKMTDNTLGFGKKLEWRK